MIMNLQEQYTYNMIEMLFLYSSNVFFIYLLFFSFILEFLKSDSITKITVYKNEFFNSTIAPNTHLTIIKFFYEIYQHKIRFHKLTNTICDSIKV